MCMEWEVLCVEIGLKKYSAIRLFSQNLLTHNILAHFTLYSDGKASLETKDSEQNDAYTVFYKKKNRNSSKALPCSLTTDFSIYSIEVPAYRIIKYLVVFFSLFK